jgi:hypothetical protein
MFNLLLMGILQREKLNLWVLEELLVSKKFKSFAGIYQDFTICHNSIRDRISTISSFF